MLRRASLLLATLAAAALAACHDSTSTPLHPIGSDSFLSQPPGTRGAYGADASQTAGGAAGVPTSASNPAAAPASSSSSTARTVEEADIYKWDGSLLYVLNTYRGLELVDLTNVAAPRLLSRVPVTGNPVDLYVRGQTAIVAVNDAFTYSVAADGSVQPHLGSRVLAVDVTAPSQPVVKTDLPIEGQVEQTRIVGNVLYVVSRKYSWSEWGAMPAAGGGVATVGSSTGGASVAPGPGTDTVFVASFDLTDPAHPAAVARVDFAATGWDTHANVTPERVTLSFAGYGLDGTGAYSPSTQFRVLDISDPAGTIGLGTTFTAPGQVRDRWGMDFDAGTGLFRAVLDSGSNRGAVLDVWQSPSPGTATLLSTLAINAPESLTAARFDGPRVYVVTARSYDPLWAIDASDPQHPKIGGALEMPGQVEFVEPLGDRLVALGHTNEFGIAGQLAVSLFDVSQLTSPTKLGRVPIGDAWGYVSAKRDDLHKAFIVLPPPPAGIGLVLVPFQGWDPSTYRYAGGTQLVDLARDTLTKRGFLLHPGAVSRAFPLDATGARLAALSDSALQVIDASNRSTPTELARLDLSRSVATLAIVHGKAVELAGDWSTGVMQLVVTDALDPDAATPLARVDLAAPEARLVQDGDLLWVLAHDWSNGASWLQGVDVSDPVHPAQRGRVDLATGESFGYGRFWGFGDEVARVGHAIAIHHSWGLCVDACPVMAGAAAPTIAGGTAASPSSEIRVYDVADPDHPRLASTVTLPGAAWAWGLVPVGSYLWATHFEWEPAASSTVTGYGMGRYYLDRIDLTDPSNPVLLAKVNVPGIFFAASADGRVVYTAETTWTGTAVKTSLHRLRLGATAVLEATVDLDGYPAGAAAANGYAWTVLTSYSSAQTSRLVAMNLGSMAVTSDQAVRGSWSWLRAAAGGKLFLDGGWNDQGLLIYDVADPAHPAFEQFFRTPSWVWDVVVADGRAYLPSGPYGVPVVELH